MSFPFNEIILNALKYLKNVKIGFEVFDHEYQILFHQLFKRQIANECILIFQDEVINHSDTNNFQSLISYLEVLDNDSFDGTFYHQSLMDNSNIYIKNFVRILDSISLLDTDQISEELDDILKKLCYLIVRLIEKISSTEYEYKKNWEKYDLIKVLINISKRIDKKKIIGCCVRILVYIYDYDEDSDVVINKIYNNTNVKEKQSNIIKAIEYICILYRENKMNKDVLRNINLLRAIESCGGDLNQYELFSDLNDKQQTDFVKAIVKYFELIYFEFLEEFKDFDPNKNSCLQKDAKMIKLITSLDNLFSSILIPFSKSFDFYMKYCEESNSIELLIGLISNQLISNIMKSYMNHNTIFSRVFEVLADSCGFFFYLLRYSISLYPIKWKSLSYKSEFSLWKLHSSENKMFAEMIPYLLQLIPYFLQYTDEDDTTQYERLRANNFNKHTEDIELREKIFQNGINELEKFDNNYESIV